MSVVVYKPKHGLGHGDVHEKPHWVNLQLLGLPDDHSDGCGHHSTSKAEVQEPVLVLKRACQLPATRPTADCAANLLFYLLAFIIGRAPVWNKYIR